jgi:hypothetical protein
MRHGWNRVLIGVIVLGVMTGGGLTQVRGAQVEFLGLDTDTQGNWKGVYGEEGYNIIEDTEAYPGYALVTPTGNGPWTWAADTDDIRAPQKVAGPDRLAACWFNAAPWTIDIDLTDGRTHQVAVYFLDWDSTTRGTTVEVLDADNNAVLDSQEMTDYNAGKYLVWKIKGHVVINVVHNTGANSVVSGLFFDKVIGEGASYEPVPLDAVTDVPRDVSLTWTPGEFAVTHDIYLGTSFGDVNDADRVNPMNVQLSQGHSANSVTPAQVLDFGQTYYWRVDEVNGAPDNTIYRGQVWSFTVEPKAIPIQSITATASAANPDMGPEKTVDGSGLDELDQHSTQPTDMWLTLTANSWIQYEFDKAYKLHEMLIWNSNQVIEAFIGFGVKEATIETSLDGENWTVVDGVSELVKAVGAPTNTANNAIVMGGIMAKFVKLSVVSSHGNMGQSGLSEVRFLAIPVTAREPMPADGETTATATVDLGWRSGREAVSHEVYLGTDADNLTLIDTTNSVSAVTDPLNYETTYFWSVSEVNDAADPTTHAGNVWSFITPEYATVDDFESYSADEGAEVYMTWFDGFGGDAALGGSTTGHIDGPFVETSIVNGGSQSLPFYYDNDGGFSDIDGKSTSPNFSEVVRELDGQDWTASGLKTLSLMFHGAAGNAGTLYVKINNTKVMYEGNAINIARPAWQVWNIDLAATGASLNNVKTMTIGVDGGSVAGLVYIDDIRLYPTIFDVTATDITTPGDTVQGLPNDDDWPAAESPDLAIDGDTSTKYLHRKGGSMATGFQVTPMVGSTVVTELTLTTANDVPNRDPITFELSGSNAGIDGPYELIASGDVVDFAGAAEWPRFTRNETAVEFNNSVAYTHYQIVFPTLRGANEALMQIAEVELIGSIQ